MFPYSVKQEQKFLKSLNTKQKTSWRNIYKPKTNNKNCIKKVQGIQSKEWPISKFQ